jgi:hypothetical protein
MPIAGRFRWTHKQLFPHHRQEHEFSCIAACLRMLAEWATALPQSEYRWRLISRTGPRGARVRDLELALKRLCDTVGPAISGVRLDAKRWRRAVELQPVLDPDTVDVICCDSFELDGTNVGHTLIVVDLQRTRAREVLAVIADPLTDSLRCESWESLVASHPSVVYRMTRGKGFPTDTP